MCEKCVELDKRIERLKSIEVRLTDAQTVEGARALVAELEAMEPVSCAVLSQDRGRSGEVPEALRTANVLTLIPRLDALIGLLEGTADALAATWDLQTGGTAKDSHAGDSRKPTIH